MKNKLWHQIEIATESQNIQVRPNDTFDGIIIRVTEVGNTESLSSRLYLNEDEMELLISKMQEMMKYLKLL